jgi:hypothetical protein
MIPLEYSYHVKAILLSLKWDRMPRGGFGMNPRKWVLVLAACGVLIGAAATQKSKQKNLPKAPELLPWSQQIAVREQWLVKRHAMLLDMMRRNHVDMWIVVNEEFHNDPLTEYVAPPRVYTGGRDIFVFVDAGDAGLKKIAVTGTRKRTSSDSSKAPTIRRSTQWTSN